MGKSLFKSICLSLACLLGIGGLAGAALSSAKKATQVSADATYYSEKKTYLYLFDPDTNKGATNLSEVNNTGTWKVSRAADDGNSNYSLWRGIPSSETVTFTRNQTLKHIYMVEVYIQQFYSQTDPTYHPVKATLSIGSTVVSTATSDGSQSSTSIFVNKLAYKGDEKDGVVKVSLNAANSSTFSFYFNDIIIFYREYSAIPVTLNDNGGSGGSGTINCTYAEAMPASVKIPTRPGYRFDGYYVGTKQYYKADGKRAFTNFDINAASATFTAKWTLMQFDITLNDNEGTGGQGSIKAIYGNAMPNLTTLPTKTGYTFQGYYSAKSGGTQYFDALGNGVGTYNLTAATTVFARWEANKYNVSFEPTPGNGGITALEATYDSPLRDLTSSEIPTREPANGHSYSFGGYYTEAPTEDENGYQTPNGKCYINDLGKSVGLWKEASDTTLYAYWTVDMTVTSSGYEGVWDPDYHGISVDVQSPEETTIYYGNQEGQCNDTNPEHFLKRDVGTYTIYFEVRKDRYTTYRHSETIVITKNVSIIDPKPTVVDGLEFTDEEQALVHAGTVDYGNMLYALSEEKLTDETELEALSFGENIPTAKFVGTYYVYYKSSGDSNHYEYSASLTNYVEIAISRVDRSEVEALNTTVLAYLDTIKDEYPEVANNLETIRLDVYQDAIVEDNITAEAVANNVQKLQDALSLAKVTVTQTLIEAIGEVSYPNSGDSIRAAQDYFDRLTEGEKAAVDATLKATLEKDNTDYSGAKEVADLINAIPEPSESQGYYDAVTVALAAYDALALSNPDAFNLLNDASDADYEKDLNDNVIASEVIKEIQAIGDVTYNKGENDSLSAIASAEANYADLTEDQKALVDAANKSSLDHDREVYDNVDATVDLIDAIGEVSHTEDKDSKEALEAARVAYDTLSEEEKALVSGYHDSTKTLEDGEAVYDAMVEINSIGEVGYSSESEEAINKAREAYDSLTEDQKAQLGEGYVKTLIKSETEYSDLKKTADIWVIILLIIASLVLAGGIWFLIVLLKKKKDKDDQNVNRGNPKKEPVKVMSIGGFFPLVILASYYLSGPWLALYIIAGLAIILWMTNLIIAIVKKNNKKKALSQVSTIEDEEESVTVTDENGNIFNIRFVKSFTAKLIQSPEETKRYYEELKNEVLSYKKTNSRISWHYDAVNAGREYVLKFAIRGKTLCVYLPLNADDYADSKYKVEKVESKKYQDVPCLYRIKNDRRLGYAKELIAVVASNLGLERGEEQHEVYSDLPYEPNKPLLERGLIKELKIQVNKPAETANEANEDEEESVTVTDGNGNVFNIRFIKSFTAKLIQSPEETKKYYEELKNEVLSYKKTNSRVSWHYDAVNAGREYVLKFAIRGKTLCVYLPLNADDYADSKYKVEKVEARKYQDVPCLYRIKNDRRLGYAKELIAVVASSLGLEKGEEQHEVYSDLPYEPNKPLLERGLIKELKVQVNKPAEAANEANEDEEESVTVTDGNGNVFNIRFVKSFTAKLIQSPEETKKYYEELKNEVLSYKKANSRVSWHYDAVNAGREYVLKFAIRGKTLCVYLPLNADDYADSKYKVEKVESRKYQDVPCLYRIKNDRRLGYAKELIAVVASSLGLEKGEEQHEVYSDLPYEPNKPLLERGLIKELKVQVNKPVETVIETNEDEEDNEVVVSQDVFGNKYETRFIKSFTAKLSQASDEVKDYYNELKNHALSYKGTSSRVSWNYDTISVGNKGILKFVIKRKNLYLYYALDTSKIGQKYHVEHVEYKKYEGVPTMLIIDSDRRKVLSKELIDRLMRQIKCELDHNLNDDYRVPFESKEVLIKKGLIKEVKVKIQ